MPERCGQARGKYPDAADFDMVFFHKKRVAGQSEKGGDDGGSHPFFQEGSAGQSFF